MISKSWLPFNLKQDLLPQQHRDILIEQLNDIVRQLKEDATKIPIVHFPPEQVSSSSPNREGGTGSKKPTLPAGSEASSQDQTSAPSSPAKSAAPAPLPASGDQEVRKSR